MKRDIDKYLKSQQSLQLYEDLKIALKCVLLKLPNKDYEFIIKNLTIMALHEGALAQVMHFDKKVKVLQITIPKNAPLSVLKFVIAHEFGHVIQNRNWKEKDGNKLEIKADQYARKIGFRKTEGISKWMRLYEKSCRRRN